MSFFGKLGLLMGMAALLATLNGCLPADTGQMDEEREPHFVEGKSRVNAQDFSGAVEAFQEALEANPRSAAAHFQLACIYDSKLPDPAAAIFHFQEYLRLNPQAGNQDVIRQSIYSCKQQLAADVLPLPSSPAAQKQLDSLMQQNAQLQQKVTELTDQVRQWNIYYASEQAAARNPAYTPPNTGIPTVSNDGNTPAPTRHSLVPIPPSLEPRTHKVLSGETIASIARKAGVSQSSILASNPGLNPRHLRAGQLLTLPPQ